MIDNGAHSGSSGTASKRMREYHHALRGFYPKASNRETEIFKEIKQFAQWALPPFWRCEIHPEMDDEPTGKKHVFGQKYALRRLQKIEEAATKGDASFREAIVHIWTALCDQRASVHVKKSPF